MSLNNTPSANRLHVALFGRRNSGKSSLINALTGQDTALVSDIPGTTTDTVSKAMEIQGIGPCLFIDTPGFDDEGELGEMRIIRTLKAIEQTDIALLLCEDEAHEEEKKWMKQLEEKNIPVILLLNKADIRKDIAPTLLRIEKDCGQKPLVISAKERTGIKKIHQAILEKLPADFGQQTITGNLAKEGDLVLLVMPQDIQAPKGRLILPQVQTMRELLDKKCLVMSCTTDQIASTLQALSRPPKLIITDSQVFHTVYERKPADSLLTSFSVLMAGYKGDIHYYIEGAFNYKGFDLSVFLYARLGQWIAYDYNTTYRINALENGGNVDYWTPENPTNAFPRPNKSKSYTQVTYYSTLKYEDGSFFKIRDITLGYTFKPELLKHLNLSRLRVYATAKNFFTFSKIDNYDPEQGGSISFPMTKQLVFGLNVEF